MSAYWNAVQACVWIATRDERLVATVRTTDTLFVTDETISNESLYEASHHVVMEATLNGKPVPLTVWDARKLLSEACATATIVMWGRERGEGELVAIPATAWAHLEMRDHRQHGVIAASPDMFDARAKWWDELRVPARAVQRQWSLPRKRYSVDAWSWDSRPDTIAEAAWGERRRRIFRDRQPTALALDADGLPDELETSLTEALSWCAFGRAVPQSFWTADLDLKHADERYASARASYANSIWRLRRAWAAKKYCDAAGQNSDSVRLDYRAACMVVNDAREAEQAAREKLASAVSDWLLLESVYESARRERNVPADDSGFPQRTLDEAQKRLLRAFLSGELKCLGRRSDDLLKWEVLPIDCFRLPVLIRLNHNILEPRGSGSMEDHRLIMEHVATWRDLKVNIAALRAWWLKGETPLSESARKDAPLPSESKRGNRAFAADEFIVAAVLADVSSGAAKSIRAAILARLAEIEGHSDDAKIRRITGKVAANHRAALTR